MGTEVMVCPQCGMYYNAADYSECPYCASAAGKPQREKKARKWWEHPTKRPAAPEPAAAPAPEETWSAAPARPAAPAGFDHTISFAAAANGEAISPASMAEPERSAPAHPAEEPVRSAPPRPEEEEKRPAPPAAPAPAPVSAPASVSGRLDSVGKTTAKYISYAGGEVVYPVVGWLVCVKGVYYGKAFPLKSGVNRVGRAADLEIALMQDQSVSHAVVVKLLYDPKQNRFMALPGESALCYVDGSCLYEKRDLVGFETVELGDSEKNCFIFVPFCGEKFDWSAYAPKD